MAFDPKDFRTWTKFAEHPIFSERSRITEWSHDPSQYSDLERYSVWMDKWYLPIDPPPPIEIQEATASENIEQLAAACQALEEVFGRVTHELVILDDLTVYVWVRSDGFAMDFYPNNFLEPGFQLIVFSDRPIAGRDEVRCESVADVVAIARGD